MSSGTPFNPTSNVRQVNLALAKMKQQRKALSARLEASKANVLEYRQELKELDSRMSKMKITLNAARKVDEALENVDDELLAELLKSFCDEKASTATPTLTPTPSPIASASKLKRPADDSDGEVIDTGIKKNTDSHTLSLYTGEGHRTKVENDTKPDREPSPPSKRPRLNYIYLGPARSSDAA
ncbi:hypothetical protein DACRYDRAFT_14992 [Dacryopinax primogenitus]|uniref:Uncharacterized protein n=1 Tax=Dacryopinax primogenitus (strain DJM 731) TaxID=1858805 RepID=M5GAR2_DACPD|nr:uncharacterized protein DACRYDRAFT_14992 [Dacryopinax primogenitus]EJU03057.1 hypothetical protein DACRYDRAFT_14992 [Dacryopinax primogenitus]